MSTTANRGEAYKDWAEEHSDLNIVIYNRLVRQYLAVYRTRDGIKKEWRVGNQFPKALITEYRKRCESNNHALSVFIDTKTPEELMAGVASGIDVTEAFRLHDKMDEPAYPAKTHDDGGDGPDRSSSPGTGEQDVALPTASPSTHPLPRSDGDRDGGDVQQQTRAQFLCELAGVREEYEQRIRDLESRVAEAEHAAQAAQQPPPPFVVVQGQQEDKSNDLTTELIGAYKELNGNKERYNSTAARLNQRISQLLADVATLKEQLATQAAEFEREREAASAQEPPQTDGGGDGGGGGDGVDVDKLQAEMEELKRVCANQEVQLDMATTAMAELQLEREERAVLVGLEDQFSKTLEEYQELQNIHARKCEAFDAQAVQLKQARAMLPPPGTMVVERAEFEQIRASAAGLRDKAKQARDERDRLQKTIDVLQAQLRQYTDGAATAATKAAAPAVAKATAAAAAATPPREMIVEGLPQFAWDLYDFIGVDVNADDHTIRTVINRLLRKTHPDHHASPDLAQATCLLNNAKDILINHRLAYRNFLWSLLTYKVDAPHGGFNTDIADLMSTLENSGRCYNPGMQYTCSNTRLGPRPDRSALLADPTLGVPMSNYAYANAPQGPPSTARYWSAAQRYAYKQARRHGPHAPAAGNTPADVFFNSNNGNYTNGWTR